MRRSLLIAGLVFALRMASGSIATAHPAWGIVVDPEGRVYFCDLFHDGGCVWRIDGRGTLSQLVARRHSHDLYLDRQGRLYGTHLAYLPQGKQWESRLWRVDESGRPEVDLIPPTRDPMQFWGDQFRPDRD